MTEVSGGVGVNGEPDDFAARYDKMVLGGGAAWVVKTLLAVVALLVIVAFGRIAIGL